jgi:hypothetical protein
MLMITTLSLALFTYTLFGFMYIPIVYTYQSVAKYVERQMRQTGHTYALTNKDAILDRLGNYTTPGFAK